MSCVQLADTLYEIDGRVRVERGPVLKVKIATPADVEAAAARQAMARPSLNDDTPPGPPLDKFGAPIEAGREFAYLDFDDQAWHIYVLAQEDWAGPVAQWRRRGFERDLALAMAQAGVLAARIEAEA